MSRRNYLCPLISRATVSCLSNNDTGWRPNSFFLPMQFEENWTQKTFPQIAFAKKESGPQAPLSSPLSPSSRVAVFDWKTSDFCQFPHERQKAHSFSAKLTNGINVISHESLKDKRNIFHRETKLPSHHSHPSPWQFRKPHQEIRCLGDALRSTL